MRLKLTFKTNVLINKKQKETKKFKNFFTIIVYTI